METTKENSPLTKRLKGSTKPLLDTGTLRASITYAINNKELKVGSNLVYAPAHQFGATITPKVAKKLTIPATKKIRKYVMAMGVRKFIKSLEGKGFKGILRQVGYSGSRKGEGEDRGRSKTKERQGRGYLYPERKSSYPGKTLSLSERSSKRISETQGSTNPCGGSVMLEELKRELEKDLSLKVILEPSHITLKEPHLRILPEFLNYTRDIGTGKVFDNNLPDKARAGVPVYVSVPLTLVFRAFGGNVNNEFLNRCLVWSLKLEKYFSFPKKIEKEWQDLGEFLVCSEALLEVKAEGQGQFFQTENPEGNEKHTLFMFEKKFKGTLRFVVYEAYEVPKVKEIKLWLGNEVRVDARKDT